MYNCMRLEKFMKRNWVKLVMLAMLLGLRPAEAGTIDTSAGWDEHTSIRWFAVPNTTTYGQTFFALDGRIDDFSFRLKGALPTTDIKMKAFIYQWAGSLVAGEGGRPIGSALSMTPLEFKPGDNSWHVVKAEIPGGLTLVPGYAYVAGFTMCDPPDYTASIGHVSFGLNIDSTYHASHGGDFVFSNNGDGGLGSLEFPWHSYQNFGDLVFKADFTDMGNSITVIPDKNPIPAPDGGSSVMLLSLGFLGLTGLRRMRKG